MADALRRRPSGPSIPGPATFPADPGTDIFSAATFAAVAEACCLGSLGKTRELPVWLSLEADSRRAKTAATLRAGIRHGQTYAETANLSKVADRVGSCTETIMALLPDRDRGILPLILRCKSRWCPPCALSLSYKRAFAIVGSLARLADHDRLTHAVYTTPNVTAHELPRAVRRLVLAWKRLHGQTGGKSRPHEAARAIRGAVRNMEITYNRESDSYHPHIHAILDADHLDQAAYTWAWDLARARADLPAVETLVYLSRLKPKPRRPKNDGVQPVCTIPGTPATSRSPEDLPSTALLDAAFEVSKYAVKPADAAGDDGFPTADLALVALALKGLHVSQATGSIRQHIADPPKPEDAPHYSNLGSLRHLLRTEPLAEARLLLQDVLQDTAARSVLWRHYNIAEITSYVTEPTPCQSLSPDPESPDPQPNDSSTPQTPSPLPTPSQHARQLDWTTSE